MHTTRDRLVREDNKTFGKTYLYDNCGNNPVMYTEKSNGFHQKHRVLSDFKAVKALKKASFLSGYYRKSFFFSSSNYQFQKFPQRIKRAKVQGKKNKISPVGFHPTGLIFFIFSSKEY